MKHPSKSLEIALLLGMLDEAFDHKAWHGTTLKGSLRGLTARQAAWRPGRGRHSIWEIAIHAAYWKYALRRRLTGEKRGSFALGGSNWFPQPEVGTDAGWRNTVALLVDEHRQLREIVAGLAPSALHTPPQGSQFTRAALVRGIAAHDLYHTGQIQLLKRLRQQ